MVGLVTKKAAPSLDQKMDGTSLKYGTYLPMLRVVINVSDPSSAMGRISKALSFEDSSNKNKVQQQSSFFDCLCCMR